MNIEIKINQGLEIKKWGKIQKHGVLTQCRQGTKFEQIN